MLTKRFQVADSTLTPRELQAGVLRRHHVFSDSATLEMPGMTGGAGAGFLGTLTVAA